MFNQTPAYNLKVVLNETSLKADVLRAWERRYHLPVPSRTPGGHRLYSAYDIAMLKWLKRRQEEGLSISRAVELWRETIAAGRDPLAVSTTTQFQFSDTGVAGEAENIDILRRDWLKANLAFDSLRVDHVLTQSFAIYPVEMVCTQIIQWGIREIGEYWYQGRVSVHQEHFASALAIRRLDSLLAAGPPPTQRGTILLGCPPGEQHTLPIILLNLLLSRKGYKVLFLGADVPLERFAETCRSVKPDLVIMAAQQLSTAAALQSTTVTLRQQGFTVAYGGLVFNRLPALREHIPAVFLGELLEAAVQGIENLAATPTSLNTFGEVSDKFHGLAQSYRQKRARIELAAISRFPPDRQPEQFLGEAITFFGNGLSAALELGDPAFLEIDLKWVQKLLVNREAAGIDLPTYLTAYQSAIQEVMASAGDPIMEWIGSYLAAEAGGVPPNPGWNDQSAVRNE